jgi:hypothetical protein
VCQILILQLETIFATEVASVPQTSLDYVECLTLKNFKSLESYFDTINPFWGWLEMWGQNIFLAKKKALINPTFRDPMIQIKS